MSGSHASKRKGGARPPIRGPRSRTIRTSRICQTPRRGQMCGHCRQGQLEYDGLAQLSCPVCGYVAEGGSFT